MGRYGNLGLRWTVVPPGPQQQSRQRHCQHSPDEYLEGALEQVQADAAVFRLGGGVHTHCLGILGTCR